MTLNWQAQKTVNPSEAAEPYNAEHVTYLAQVIGGDENTVNVAIGSTIDKAVSLLNDNIDDNSRYFIFEWDVAHSALSIVVTDDKKQSDSPIVVTCCFAGLDKKMKQVKAQSQVEWEKEASEYAEVVKDIARDYLTTCHRFFSFSLVAIFHSDGRNKSALL